MEVGSLPARGGCVRVLTCKNFRTTLGATEASYLAGDIYFFKLKEWENAGDAYLAVARTKPVGPHHRDALLNAITAFENVRKAQNAKGALPSDSKLGEAIDLYATLFPNDAEMAGLLVKNGDLFYAVRQLRRGRKALRARREKYPQNPVALHAGDRILE